jgi:hypothetical protein
MDNTGSDRFALEVFNLAFSIQRILQSQTDTARGKRNTGPELL